MAAARVIPDMVTVSNRGGSQPVRLPVAQVAVSWEISAAGSLSCFARIQDLRRLGLGDDLQGRWLTWSHPIAGDFGGVITGRPVSDGLAEISADGWASLLRGRVVTTTERPSSGGGGGLMRRAMVMAGSAGVLFLDLGAIDEGGDNVAMSLAVGDISDDILPQIAGVSGVEWRVTADRVFTASRRLGHDRSASVRLVEDRHVVQYRLENDMWSEQKGTLYVLETQEDLIRSVAQRPPSQLQAANLGSPNTYLVPYSGADNYPNKGDLQFIRRPPANMAVTQGSESSSPPAWALEPAGIGAHSPAVPSSVSVPLPTVPLSVTLVNADNNWARWDIGDTVWVDLGSAGFSGLFRPTVKALGSEGETMTASGEALQVA